MAESQQLSDSVLSKDTRVASSVFTIRKGCILESLEPRKRSYDLQPSEDILRSDPKNTKETKLPRVRCQYTLALVGFLVNCLNGILRINTSVSIVAMVNQSAISEWTEEKSDTCLAHFQNSTEIESPREDGEFAWQPKIQGYILASYFLSYVIVQFPSGKFAERFGAKWLLFYTTLIASVSTLLFPAFAWIDASAVLMIQIVRGLAQGCSQPTIAVLVSNWSTRVDRGLLLSFILTGFPLGIFFGGIYSGFLCDSYGRWPSSLYATGTFGVIVSILILFLVHENPDAHPRISKAEKCFILSNQETKLSTRRPNVPWRKILTSVPVHAMVIGTIGQNWAFAQFLVVHATFFGTILDYPTSQNGSLVAITFLLMFLAGQVGTWLSSLMIKRNITSVTSARKLFDFLACFGFSVGLFGVSMAGCNKALSIGFAVLSTTFTGFGMAVGCLVVSAEMSPAFSGTLCALLNSATVSSFILPVVVGYLTEGMQTLEQWNKVFFISIGVVMFCGIFFIIFGSADVQPWNYVGQVSGEKEKDKQTRF